ncbi:MAG: MFS transporter, partial [Clostridiales bacterium]|nr:MFS transporter [Clostridiales bacterium]
FYFITYSLVQIILFFCMDKINVKWYMLISVFASGIVTVIIAIATSLWQLWWILAINGILQAGIWGMCTGVLNKYLPINLKAKANMIMNIGTAVAGIISYGSASLFISFKTIASPFVFFGFLLSFSAILFFVAVSKCAKLKSNETINCEPSATVKQVTNLPFSLKTNKTKNIFYVVSFLFSVLVHFVFYGVLNWIPNLLQENFSLPENVAIIISVLAPLATMLGPIIAINHCEKQANFIKVGLIYSIIATIFSLLLVFLYKANLVLSLAILIIYLIIIQGIVTIIFSVISYKLSDYINAGAHSGLMNAAGGISAGIAPPIIGAVIENAGWQISYVSILLMTLFITMSTILILFLLNKKRNEA